MINIDPKKEKILILLFLSVFFCATLTLAFLSNGTYESGDSIQHFLISKYSFKHPHLFLDHWGKPVFTLLSSPFSQFGFIGICFFNILCATITGYLSYLTAKKLNLGFSWLAPLFSLMAPIYYVTLISGLTEPLFGLVLLLSVYLFISEKYFIGSVIVSFLPFVRSEGFILLPLFGIVLLLKRSYKNIPMLALGTFIYSIVGLFFLNDFLWIIHQNPYKDVHEIYGNGSLFHFINKNEFILGTPLVILFLLGCFSVTNKKVSSEYLILVLGSWFLVLFFHSFVWWKGIFGSLGLIRVIAGVTPLAGIIALSGLSIIHKLIKKKIVFNIFLSAIIILVLVHPFKQHEFPRQLNYEEVVVKQSADWIKQNKLQNGTQFYMFPYYSVFMDIDPFDDSKTGNAWNINTVRSKNIILWDNHFFPNEGKLSLNKFQDTTDFELLTQFKADPTKTPSTKQLFEVYIYRKK